MESPFYEAPVEETTFMLCKPDVSHLHLQILQEVIDNGFQVQAKNFRITPMVAAVIASHFPSVQKRKAADIAAGRLKQSTDNNFINGGENKSNSTLDNEFNFLKWSNDPEFERQEKTHKAKETWRWDRRNKKYDFTCGSYDSTSHDNVGWQIVETHRKREDAHRDLYNMICNSTRFPGHDLAQQTATENDNNSIKNSTVSSDKDEESSGNNNNTNKNDSWGGEEANNEIDKTEKNNKNNLLMSSSTSNNTFSTRRLSQINFLHESREDKWRRLHEPHASLPVLHSSSLPTTTNNNNTIANSSYWNNTLFDANKVENMLYEELLAEHVKFLSCSGTCMAVMLTGANAIERLNELVGPEDPHDALRLAPHSLHARIGMDLMKNGVYAAGNVNEAAVCIEAVFGYASPFADQLKTIDTDNVASCHNESDTTITGNYNYSNVTNYNNSGKGNVLMDRYVKRWGKRVEQTVYDVFAYPPSSILHLPKHTANITLDHSSSGAYYDNYNCNENMNVNSNNLMPMKLSSMMPHPSNCPAALRLSYYLEEDVVRSFCDDDQWIGLPHTNATMLTSLTSPSSFSTRNGSNIKNNNNAFSENKWRQVKTTFINDTAEIENVNSNSSNEVKLIDYPSRNNKFYKSSYFTESSTANSVNEKSQRVNVSFVPSKDKGKTWSSRPRSPFGNTATNSVNATFNPSTSTSSSSSSFATTAAAAAATTTGTLSPRKMQLSDDELSIARSEIAKIKRELGLQAKVLHAREMDYLLREHALRRPMEKYVEENEPLATIPAIRTSRSETSNQNTNNNKLINGKLAAMKDTQNKSKKGEVMSLTYATLKQPFGKALNLVNKSLTYSLENSNASTSRFSLVPRSPMITPNRANNKDYRKEKKHLSWREVYEEEHQQLQERQWQESQQPSTRLGSHSALNSWKGVNAFTTEARPKTPNVVLVKPTMTLEQEDNISASRNNNEENSSSRFLHQESAMTRQKCKTATPLETSKALYAKEQYQFNWRSKTNEESERSESTNSNMLKQEECKSGRLFSPSVSPVSSNNQNSRSNNTKASTLELGPLRPLKFKALPVIDATNANDLIYSEEARLALFHSLTQKVNENINTDSNAKISVATVSKQAIIAMLKQSAILHPALMTFSSASIDDAIVCYVNDRMNSDDECDYHTFALLLLRLLKK